MKIIDKLKDMFGSSKEWLDGWKELTKEEQIQQLMQSSVDRPQLLYKHSNTCSICYMARKEIEKSFDQIEAKADMYFINIIDDRPVSNALAEQFDVRHESPQVLIIYRKECAWHKSHHAIKADAILKKLSELETTAV